MILHVATRLRQAAVAVMAALCVSIVPTGAVGVPAGASPDAEGYFVNRVYYDFLHRTATDAERSQWTNAMVGGTTRAQVVSSVVHGAEFAERWVASLYLNYLDDYDATSTVFVGDLSVLQVTHDFLESELRILERSSYYTYAGGANTSFVNRLYEDLLNRAGDAADVSYWAGRLTAGTVTLRGVATFFIRGSEGATLRVRGVLPNDTACGAIEWEDVGDVWSGSYCLILDRVADTPGLSFWVSQMTGSGQLPALWASVAGSTEYWNEAQVIQHPSE